MTTENLNHFVSRLGLEIEPFSDKHRPGAVVICPVADGGATFTTGVYDDDRKTRRGLELILMCRTGLVTVPAKDSVVLVNPTLN